jgi:hypothetical protein
MKRTAYHDYAALLAKPPAQRTYTEKLAQRSACRRKGLMHQTRLVPASLHATEQKLGASVI